MKLIYVTSHYAGDVENGFAIGVPWGTLQTEFQSAAPVMGMS